VKVKELFSDLLASQNSIARWRGAWDGLSSELFDSEKAKEKFESAAVSAGAFKRLALASTPEAMADAKLALYSTLASLKNYRAVIADWTAGANTPRISVPNIFVRDSDDVEDDFEDLITPQIGGREAFERVKRQQVAVFGQLQRGDIDRARKFADELIAWQIGEGGGAEYAAKSLCLMAQDAKKFGIEDLHLEWSTRAAELVPQDTRATGQAADACIVFGRFEEALRLLDLTETWGNRLFAETNRARILKAQARLDDALVAFERLEREFAGHQDTVFAWAGHAEVLRDMWRLEDALATYSKGIALHPTSRGLRCGKAAVLTDLGRLEEAEAEYAAVIRDLGTDRVALNGNATVLREMGLLEDSLKIYDIAINEYPHDHYSRCGRAEVLRLKGDLDGALSAFQDATRRFPYVAVPFSGIGEVYRDRGEFAQALDVLEMAIRRFPREPMLQNTRAVVLKSLGRLGDSLRAYDEIVHNFPYDIGGLIGRADLLKELGQLDEALSFYDRVIQRWPAHPVVRNAKAAILVSRGHLSEAFGLLPQGIPRTQPEWVAEHIRGMVLLKGGRLEDALNHFTKGMLEVPFERPRRAFAKGCAIARLRLEQFSEAQRVLVRNWEPLGQVLHLHAHAADGHLDVARSIYQEIQEKAPERFHDLAGEIASRFLLRPQPPKHDGSWIFDKECDALLLQAA
jgi:tetratricopeptide (TPR) repeat protein